MLTAIIVDDESKGRLTLQSLLGTYCPNINVVAQAADIPDAVSLIQHHIPDIIFLDIQLQDGNGFDILNILGKIYSKIIFVTAYDEYAVKAFRFSAIDYLLKPLDPDLLIAAVEKVENLVSQKIESNSLDVLYENLTSSDKKIVINSHQGQLSIRIADIIRCEADSNYTTIYNANGTKTVVTKSLREYEELLSDDNFFRVHKSHLVNLSYVKSYDLINNYLTLENESIIEIARRRKDALVQYLEL